MTCSELWCRFIALASYFRWIFCIILSFLVWISGSFWASQRLEYNTLLQAKLNCDAQVNIFQVSFNPRTIPSYFSNRVSWIGSSLISLRVSKGPTCVSGVLLWILVVILNVRLEVIGVFWDSTGFFRWFYPLHSSAREGIMGALLHLTIKT